MYFGAKEMKHCKQDILGKSEFHNMIRPANFMQSDQGLCCSMYN